MKRNTFLYFLILFAACTSRPNDYKNENKNITDWAPSFHKVDIVNPILVPDTNSRFFCPLQNDSVAWEAEIVAELKRTLDHLQ